MTIRIDRSLRARLIQSVFGMIVLVAALFGVGIHLVLDAADDLLFDGHIATDIRTFIAQYQVDPGVLRLPRENFTVYVVHAGAPELPADVSALPAGADELVRDGRLYDVHVEQRGGTTFYFLFDETLVEQYDRAVTLMAFGTVAVVVVVALGLSAYFVNRIVGPVTALTRRVLGMGAGSEDLLAVDPQGPQDELYHLASSINGYIVRIRAVLQREREFSSDVAHELRTPLMGIQGAAENLELGSVRDEATSALVARIRRRCLQMTTLIDALMCLAREPVEAERAGVEVDVGSVVDEQLAMLREAAQRRGIDLRVHREHAPRVRAVPAAVSVVLSNLLKNAVTHTDGSVVDVYLTTQGVVVQDYGPGIDRAFQSVMFDRFTRGETRYATGAGIGLSLVRRLCDLFGWEVDVSSTVGVGTRIALTFA
jgi:signal transduction histidine kinase